MGMETHITINEIESPLEGLCDVPVHRMTLEQLTAFVERIRSMREARQERVEAREPEKQADFFAQFE